MRCRRGCVNPSQSYQISRGYSCPPLAISGVAGRLIFDTPAAGDDQSMKIMTNLEWKKLTLATEVRFKVLKKGKSSEFNPRHDGDPSGWPSPKTVTAVTRGDYFSNLTKTESQFKISFLNFFHFFLHHNTSWYIVVLGRRKNPTLFWASFGKLNFLTAAESAANASEQAKQALRQFLNCSLWFAGDKIISKDLPGCFATNVNWNSLSLL